MGTSMECSTSKIPQCSVIQLNNVSLIEKCSELVLSLRSHFPSIYGIARQCDYVRNVFGDTVFIFVSNQADYVKARSNPNIPGPSVSFPKVFMASVDKKSAGLSDNNLIAAVPGSAGLYGFNFATINTSAALYIVLKYFEDQNFQVTGFRWYVEGNGKARNYGFLQFFNDEDDSVLKGTHSIVNCSVKVRLNRSIILMLDIDDQELVEANRSAPLTRQTVNANKFSTTINSIALSVIGTNPLHTIRISLHTRSFFAFKNQFLEVISNFELALYFQCSTYAIALIGFRNRGIAEIYKTMIKNMNEQTVVEVGNAEDNENEMMQKAQLLLLKPYEHETLYIMGKDEQVMHCLYEQEWTKLTFQLKRF